MSTPDVLELIRLPGGTIPAEVTGRLRLVATSTEGTRQAFGYGPSNTIVSHLEGTWDATTGTLTFADVVPNGSITPANTTYEVSVHIPGHGALAKRHITVTDVVGPVYVDDLLTAAPSSLPATGTEIDDLGTAGVVADGDYLPINQSGTTYKITAANLATSATFAEAIRDTIGTALTAGANITLTVNDGANTITVAVSGLTSTTLSDFTEAVQDVVGALTGFGGSGLTYTYNDGSNTVDLAVNVDNSTIEVSSDALRVKADGITDSHLNSATLDALSARGLLVYSQAYVRNWPSGLTNGTSVTFPSANRAYYFQIVEVSGLSVSTAYFTVGTSSGNISVGTYNNTGSVATARKPNARQTTSGAVACPSAGAASVAVSPTSTTPAIGEWLGFSCDNTTAAFRGFAIAASFDNGFAWFESSAHPLPATATASTAVAGGYHIMAA